MNGDADICTKVGAWAAKLLDHFVCRSEIAPSRAGGQEFERHAADDEDLIGLSQLLPIGSEDDFLVALKQWRAFE